MNKRQRKKRDKLRNTNLVFKEFLTTHEKHPNLSASYLCQISIQKAIKMMKILTSDK